MVFEIWSCEEGRREEEKRGEEGEVSMAMV